MDINPECVVHGERKVTGLEKLKEKYGDRVIINADGSIMILMTEFEGCLQAEVDLLRASLEMALHFWSKRAGGGFALASEAKSECIPINKNFEVGTCDAVDDVSDPESKEGMAIRWAFENYIGASLPHRKDLPLDKTPTIDPCACVSNDNP